jgi:hypothetical protein
VPKYLQGKSPRYEISRDWWRLRFRSLRDYCFRIW